MNNCFTCPHFLIRKCKFNVNQFLKNKFKKKSKKSKNILGKSQCPHFLIGESEPSHAGHNSQDVVVGGVYTYRGGGGGAYSVVGDS